MKTILVCYTPLHVLIAERLVDEGHIGQFYFLYICFNESASHRFYFKKLADRANFGASFLRLSHDLRDLRDIIRWRCRARSFKPDYLSTGNVKHFHSRFVAYLCGVRKFKTFDDGGGNIVNDGYFSNLQEIWIGKILFSIFSPIHLYRNVVSFIETHFSIYAERNVFEDFVSDVRRVGLTSAAPELAMDANELATVFLGHAFVEDNLRTRADAEKLDRAIFHYFAVDSFLPHPRSRGLSEYSPLNEHAVREPYIAEDLVLRLLGKFKKVRVVGINSTALLNVPQSQRIQSTNIDIGGLFAKGALKAAMQARGVQQISESELYAYDKKEVS